MNSVLRTGISLSLLAALASCGGGSPVVVTSPGAAAPTGSTFVGTSALPGVPSNAVVLARVHGLEQGYTLVHSWVGMGPESLGASGEELAKAVDFERGGAVLVTVDKDANLDKVLAGDEQMPVQGIAVLAIRDMGALKDFTSGATDVGPGRKRFLDKENGAMHTKLQCDVQTASISNTGFVVCGDERAMRDLYAVATTTVMALRPTAQVHMELHLDAGQPLLDNAWGKAKGLASMVPGGDDMLAMQADSLAMLADMSDFVWDIAVDPSGMRTDFSQTFPRRSSEMTKACFAEPKSHHARAWFEQQPGETMLASYSDVSSAAYLERTLPAIKRVLEKESKGNKTAGMFMDVFTVVGKRLANTTQVAVAGGVDGSSVRALAAKLVAHESDKKQPDVTSGEFPGYAAMWHDGDAWLLPADVAPLKKALNASSEKKAGDKSAEKSKRAPSQVELVAAKILPPELAGATVIRMREGKLLAASAKTAKGAKATSKEDDVQTDFYVAEVPFMGGRVLLGGLYLPTLATVLRRTTAAGSKVANVGVFKARGEGTERSFGFMRTDLMTPVARIVEAHAKDKAMSMVGSVMSLMDSVERSPTAEVSEFGASIDGKTVRSVMRVPASAFVDVATMVRSMDKHEPSSLDKEL